MTRRRILAIAAPLALLLVLPAIGSASSSRAHSLRSYEGKTSQDRLAAFDTVETATGWGLKDATFDLILRCPDETRTELATGASFAQPLRLDSRNRFTYDNTSFDSAIHFHGRLGSKVGSGTVKAKLATLNQDEQAQVCTSKQLDWTVKRLSKPILVPTPTEVGRASRLLTINITVDGRGHAHIRRLWS